MGTVAPKLDRVACSACRHQHFIRLLKNLFNHGGRSTLPIRQRAGTCRRVVSFPVREIARRRCMEPFCLGTYVSLRTIRRIRKIASASVDIDSIGVRPCQFQIKDRGTHTPHSSCEKPHVPVYTL